MMENTATKPYPATATADQVKTPATKSVDPSTLPKTTGEKYYDVLQFLTGKAFIIVISGAIAYFARYGKESYGKVPNYLKKFQDGFEKLLNENKLLPLGKSNVGKYFSGFASATTLTMWGGNLFAPFLKAFENSKEKISNYFNKRYGTPEEVEIAHERLKDMPKQNWMDIIKGRVIGWISVCSSFIAVDMLISKDLKKDLKNSRLAQFEEKTGRWFAGFTQEGKTLSKIPLTQKLTVEQAKALSENKAYRTGKIVALDFFATSAAIIIWNAVSRYSASKRSKAQKAARDITTADVSIETVPTEQSMPEPQKDPIQATGTITPRLSEGYVGLASEPSTVSQGISA